LKHSDKIRQELEAHGVDLAVYASNPRNDPAGVTGFKTEYQVYANTLPAPLPLHCGEVAGGS
jgi:hypothetical protein